MRGAEGAPHRPRTGGEGRPSCRAARPSPSTAMISAWS